jgi:hypothetical protein
MTDFADPGTGGDKLPLNDLLGSLLYIEAISYERDIQTVHGPSDAIKANVAVLDGANKGDRYDDTLIFPKVLRSQLSGNIGKLTLGRLSQGKAQPGKSAPWQLEPSTDADRAVGQKYVAYLATQKAVVEEDEPPF